MNISLSGLHWEVKGYWPYVPEKEKSMETGQTLHGVTDWLPAKVPGGVHYDLFRAGLIENPYYGKNSLHCEWAENRWWMYRTGFPSVFNGCDLAKERVRLTFEGVDYEASVFFNDQLCAEHKGMYEPFSIDLTGRIREENKLVVLLKGIPQEMGQIGYTSRTFTQKSRFNYKWDFSTRLVNIGIWKDVVLEVPGQAELSDLHLDTGYCEETGRIYVSGQGLDYRDCRETPLWVRITAEDPGTRCSGDAELIREQGAGTAGRTAGKRDGISRTVPLCDGRFDTVLLVEDPLLWYPNGAGPQYLYRIRIELLEEKDGRERVLYQTERNTGIRSLKMVHNKKEHENALPYTFEVNGRKLYIKGVNMTPLDHIYGNVTKEQYGYMVSAMVNAGVNLVRVWGGGLIEKEEFYDLCDENGILIWQEFIQSSSGIDNKPSEQEEFLELLKKTAECAVREKRNHVSLTVYSGGNELMEAPDRPCGMENKNIAMLEEIVRRLDGRRAFLPTSASGPREFVTSEKGVSHDVHGSWRYEGNPGHYVLYGESDNLFHSEFGMDAASCEKSLKKFLPRASLHPTPMSQDPCWQHHGEWWGTYFRDCEMFGSIEKTPENLGLFTRCSQYMQGEGLRFILEADRRRAWQNSGTIIWQLNEPWPNASCTNLVDYYGETKTAYYQVKRAYEERHVSLDYRSLTYKKGENFCLPFYVSNSGEAFSGKVRILVRSLSGKVLAEDSRSTEIPENRSIQAGMTEGTVPEEALFFVTLYLEEEGRTLSENTYMFGTREKEVFAPLFKNTGKAELKSEKWETRRDGRQCVKATLINTGERAVLDAGIALAGNQYYLLGSDNDRVLFPGEERSFSLALIPKKSGGFSESENYDGSEVPKLTVHWL